ncbi:methyltransferase [Nocardia thraciensis]
MTPHLRLMNMMFGTICSQVVGAAARLGLADHLGDAELTPAELAAATGTHPGALARLLRALAALDLVTETRAGAFGLSETGMLLRTDRPDSQAAAALLFTDPAMLRAWERPEDAVRTGRPTFEGLYGTDFFGFLAANPQLSQRFNTTMRQITLPIAQLLPASYEFTRHRTLVDVGGGDGTVLSEILRAVPGLRGVLFDSAAGLAEAAATLAAAAVTDRCRVEAGDFFSAVPAGADAYLLKSILHDWDDERCVAILGRCRSAISDSGRLLIVETVLPEAASGAEPALYLSDVNMLVNMGGQERTRSEFETLCGRAGFSITAAHPMTPPAPYSIIEAKPV